MISIDGTHLYGKYRGVLLIAMATNANNKIFPLAFAVVNKESGPSWRWFLECLRISIGHVILDKGICIIFDQHTSIKSAIATWPRGDDGRVWVFHQYFLRHVASNFNTQFQDPILKALALKAGYATQEAKFESIMQNIKEVEINALRRNVTIQMKKGDLDKWT